MDLEGIAAKLPDKFKVGISESIYPTDVPPPNIFVERTIVYFTPIVGTPMLVQTCPLVGCLFSNIDIPGLQLLLVFLLALPPLLLSAHVCMIYFQFFPHKG